MDPPQRMLCNPSGEREFRASCRSFRRHRGYQSVAVRTARRGRSFISCERCQQPAVVEGIALGEFAAAHARDLARESRARGLLGVHVRQLDSDRPVCQSMESRLRVARSGRDRRARAGVEFGKRAENIDRGIRDRGLTYPIAIDNDFVIWRAFGNDAWPAKYLFDDRGRLVRRWAGEGSYDEIEREIRRLLVAARPGVAMPPVTGESLAFAKTGQPSYAGLTEETYVGAERGVRGVVTLKGDWHTDRQYV